MDDLISRQDAINEMRARRDAAKEWYDDADEDSIRIRADSAMASFIECILTLQTLPSAQPERNPDEWCAECKEYDTEKHCCPRFNKVIRMALQDAQPERKTGKWIVKGDLTQWYACSVCGRAGDWKDSFCRYCGADMRSKERSGE